MAIQTFFSPNVIIHQSVSLRKSVFSKKAVFRNSQLPVRKLVKLQIKSSIGDQYFEDHASGIICYEDEKGEMICEGFDEGPRLLKPYYLSRDADIFERLQWSWQQLMDGQTANDVAFLEGRRCNGFNALH